MTFQDFQLDYVSNGEFSFCNVSQVITASECVFRDMTKELNLGDFTGIRQSHFNKRTVPKEKLSESLPTVCHIPDSFSIPHLRMSRAIWTELGNGSSEGEI